ncbi:5-oxoprolinase (ATP-hydrolyzing) [Thermodesulfatator indicus DSM 15286]|uniref:5-oxoprolinase (ATP-hydrolyzing) n=1 Tax=Thermodesulfatator indicus (strain DSM 15286 / JCM 11887 / CIR29812) TaxID=667014 RepID=F8AB40_THEID|nr:hydantoinase/oxoprolinase family protein [Thermodesulfatator indicus]AEH44410.1 5-oxoprolinase (ATP-hydrolyzing) [Thermodesulfatator indicus DSM 15286]
MRVAVDTGGTFTDFVAEVDGKLLTHKVSSTPQDPSQAVLKGLSELGLDNPQVLLHGTTVGTNAFLTRRGAKVLLITTKGFEDIIFIGRQNRPSLYDFFVDKPEPLLRSSQVLGIAERIDARGEIIKGLSSEELELLKRFVEKRKFQSIAVSFLHSYINPVHEQKVKEALQFTGLPISLSSEILPEFREFERTSTTLINAYLAPVMAAYVGKLTRELPNTQVFLMQSSGGLMPAEAVGKRAAATLLSGPAAGVYGAFSLARRLGREKIITFDMGGTSTDVSLCNSSPTFTRQYALEGYPVHLKKIDIHTIGAGGGSLIYFDKAGALKVGPESAGANPGPACYQRGGTEPTVTDANLLLGRLPTEHFLGGRLRLSKDLAQKAFAKVAKKYGFDSEELALGALEIVNTNMEQAIKKVSVEKGLDPQDFTLVCFGGAGGLHAISLAERLRIKEVLVPRFSGVLSALGLLLARPAFDFSRSIFLRNEEVAFEYLLPLMEELAAKALKELARYGYRKEDLRAEAEIDIRYQGQSYELTVPFTYDFKDRFHVLHQQLYGYSMPFAPLEVTAIRLNLSADPPEFELPLISGKKLMSEGKGKVILSHGKKVDVSIFRWDNLPPESEIKGPALIVGAYATVWIEPFWRAWVDKFGNVWLTR